MAICTDCGQETKTADTCTFDLIKFERNGKPYPRSRYHFDEPSGRCHDCGIQHGGIHHFGCDVEQCPKYGLQLLGCECQGKTVWLAKSK